MCWGREVSAAFALLELASIVFLAVRNKGLDRLILPFLFTIFTMEALEVAQWHFVEPISSKHAGESTCHPVNWAAMLLSITGVTSQPYFWNIFLEKTNRDPRHASLFAFTRIASLIMWLGFMASLVVGELWGFNTATAEFAREKQGHKGLWAPTTCGYAGTHGHLQWSVAFSLHELFPSAFAYFLLMTLPAFWHFPKWAAATPAGILLCVLGVLLYFMDGNIGEAYSIWCFAAIGLHVYYIALPYWVQWPVDKGADTQAKPVAALDDKKRVK